MSRLAILKKIIRTKHQNRAFYLYCTACRLVLFSHKCVCFLYTWQSSFTFLQRKSGKNKNKLKTIYPKNQENFKNSKPKVHFYWFLYKKECIVLIRYILLEILPIFPHSVYATEYLLVNPFVPNAPFLDPLKTSENLGFFWCSRSREKVHWEQMG